MAEKYDHKQIEPKWQKYWEEHQTFKAVDGDKRKKYYALDMFAYPSGEGLHTGHPRSYTATDIFARYYRMKGYNVMRPIGWDAFGLPAENYAIKKGVHPAITTKENIANFTRQVKSFGFAYDWNREVNTSDPSYYKWTQWLFKTLYDNGLAYQKEAEVNWCPKDQTVLANEQVVNGCCERCGTQVEQKRLKQWFFKITEFADELITGLDNVDWPESTKTGQKNWIGKSEGAMLQFKSGDFNVEVFTTRADTLFGATYLVLAPEYELVVKLTTPEQKAAVEKYIEQTKKKSTLDRTVAKEKTGVFTGSFALNPATGKDIPIWIADYVLMNYGTGAIMAVPAHDERDFEFAKKFDLPIQQVIMPCAPDPYNPPKEGLEMVKRDTVIVHLRDKSTGKYALLDWHETLEGISTAIMGGIEPGQTPEEAALMEIKEEAALEGVRIIRRLNWITAAEYCASHKNQNRKAVAYGLLAEVDNLAGQGKIDEKELKNHTLVWVDEKEVLGHLTPDHQKLVWQLLNNETALSDHGELMNSSEFDGMNSAEAASKIAKKFGGRTTVQYKLHDWLISRQRYWGAPIPIIYLADGTVRTVDEADLPVVLPEDVDFKPTGESPLAKSKTFQMGVEEKYGKGARRELDTMDTFVCSSWYYLRYCDPRDDKEFASEESLEYWMPVDLYIGGAEHTNGHLLYARFITKALHKLGYLEFDEPFLKLRHQGLILASDGEKMSKSRGNVINPDELIEQYGADAVRMYEMFMGPFDQAIAWDTSGILGVRKFLDKVYRVVNERAAMPAVSNDAIHRLVKKVTEDIEEMKFNTAIAAFMEFMNEVGKDASNNWLADFVKLLNPFAPHLAEELWQETLKMTGSAAEAEWPKFDAAKAKAKTVVIAVQEKGKLRGTIELPVGTSEQEVLAAVQQDEKLKKVADGSTKHIFVMDRIINFI